MSTGHSPSPFPFFPRLARSAVGYSLLLYRMMRWWVVGSALSSRWCLRRAMIRARVSSAGDCNGGQLPVRH
eukprot:scaffold19953_cov95-Isochrysis_galbana.AAC.4